MMSDDINDQIASLPVATAPPLDLTPAALNDEPSIQLPPTTPVVAQTEVTTEQPSITYYELPLLPDSITVEQEAPILTKNPHPFDEDKEILILPTDTVERVADYTSKLPNVDYNDEESVNWLEAISEGNTNTRIRGGFFTRRLAKTGSKFRQTVRTDKGQVLAASTPNIGSEGLSTLSGTHALIRMRAQMHMGSVLYVPLWHSGFWLALRTPSDSAMVNLFTRIEASKIRFGRSTYGIAFGNSSVFYAQEIFKFAIEHMIECTLKDPTMVRLEEHIKQPDIFSIANALAALHWSRGFQYVRPIFDAGGKERKLIKDLIDIRKTMWVDNSVLTKRQIAMMANRTNASVTDEMLKSYQDEFVNNVPTPIRLSETQKAWIHCRIPSLKDHFNCGQEWVNSIVSMTEEAFAQDISDDARNQRIALQAQASSMRQYSHWINAITISEDPNDLKETVTKREVVDELLSDMASDDELRDNYFRKVREFIDESTFVICAVPAFDKEEIEKTQTSRRFPILVPIDPMATFFTLLVQKIRRISQRP